MYLGQITTELTEFIEEVFANSVALVASRQIVTSVEGNNRLQWESSFLKGSNLFKGSNILNFVGTFLPTK